MSNEIWFWKRKMWEVDEDGCYRPFLAFRKKTEEGVTPNMIVCPEVEESQDREVETARE